MAGKDRPTAEQAEAMFQTPQMKTIFSRMQDLLGINPVEAKQVTIRKPYVAPSMIVKSKYIAPNTFLFENPEYLVQKAKEAALKDMAESGIKIDARLEHPE